ncbi:MAG: PEP-CTERM sorting domain-containing protein, partial [Akkermansiaceae bacterium]|nr:PEP-CTERM sorting domain-containing protein [Akkermansiaceae bacterium]
DLQRLVPDGTVNTDEVAGQSRFGSYEGTVTIGSNGSVSFITIPEPSSITLAGIAGLALAFRRRRNA